MSSVIASQTNIDNNNNKGNNVRQGNLNTNICRNRVSWCCQEGTSHGYEEVGATVAHAVVADVDTQLT